MTDPAIKGVQRFPGPGYDEGSGGGGRGGDSEIFRSLPLWVGGSTNKEGKEIKHQNTCNGVLPPLLTVNKRG